MEIRESFRHCRRLVVKAGTSILSSSDARISQKCLRRLGLMILDLLKDKRETVLVSSGAIAFGMEAAGIRQRPKEMAKLQACAAVGQGRLMQAYETFFSSHGLPTAQLLLTRDGLEDRARFLAARRTLEELFKMETLPIVNENDTVATDEIKFGDNDILSVQVAHLIHADLLVILSDVDGFYLKDGSRIRTVTSEEEIEGELVGHLRDRLKENTVGGMRAKLEAARVAMRLGVPLLLVNGHEEGILPKVLAGEDVGTLFAATGERKNARKKWIAFSAPRRGALSVDEGAFEALKTRKKSLLPSGILKVRGHFERGEVVELETLGGEIFGRGRVRYSSRELAQIAGKKTHEIEGILGYKYHDEVIHRNDLVTWS